MIDFTTTFCDLHPKQLISNFCSQPQCQIGLCATCICTHTQMHMQTRTPPHYENIRNTYTQLQDQLRTRIQAMDQQKTRITQLLTNIEDKRQQITECVAKARYQTLQTVNGYFDQREKELLHQTEVEQKKNSLHSESRMQTLLNSISREINTLYNAATELNSHNFLESFKRVSSQVLVNSVQTEKEIGDELSRNQHYETTVAISPDFIAGVKLCLEKSIMLSFGEKHRQQGYSPEEEKSIKSKRLALQERENGMKTSKRYGDSLSKSIMVSPTRFSAQNVDSFPSYFPKSSQFQPFPRRPTTETIYINNSLPIGQILNSPTNKAPQFEQRGRSSEKGTKENTPFSLKQSAATHNQLESKYLSQDSQSELKKMRKSGLTIFKSIDNEAKQKN